MSRKPLAEKCKDCAGCYDDLYNRRGDGQFCWSLPTAKKARYVFVHIDQRPPWRNKSELVFSCMKRQRYVKMTVEQRDRNNAACEEATRRETMRRATPEKGDGSR